MPKESWDIVAVHKLIMRCSLRAQLGNTHTCIGSEVLSCVSEVVHWPACSWQDDVNYRELSEVVSGWVADEWAVTTHSGQRSRW